MNGWMDGWRATESNLILFHFGNVPIYVEPTERRTHKLDRRGGPPRLLMVAHSIQPSWNIFKSIKREMNCFLLCVPSIQDDDDDDDG